MARLAKQTPLEAAAPTGPPVPKPPLLSAWLRAQAVNSRRHAAALRPFQMDEFGTGIAAPSEGHIQSVNQLVTGLRSVLLKRTAGVSQAASLAMGDLRSGNIKRLLRRKEQAHNLVRSVQKV